MSLTDLDVKSVTAGDDTTVSFAINFAYADAAEVVVYEVTSDVEVLKVQGSDYSISGSNVLMEVAPATGTDLVIIRETLLNQPSDFENSGPITLANFEKRLDVLTQMSQELSEKIDRTMKLPRSGTLSNLSIPTPEANKVLGWNTAATAIENKTLTLTGASASSQAEAEAGTNNTKFQTPLRTKQAFDAFIDTSRRTVTAKSGTFTPGDNEDVFVIDASGGALSVNLPAASGRSGKRYTFKKTGSDYNIITIDPNGSEKIDVLSTTFKLRIPNDSVTVMCDGTAWHVIERKGSEYLGDIATTLSWTAGVGTPVYSYFREGAFLKIIGYIPITGAVTAATLTLTLPNSWAMYGGLYDSNTGVPVGRTQYFDNGTAIYGGNIRPISTTVLQFEYLSRDAATELIETIVVNATAPFTWANTDSIFFELEIPMNDWSG